MNKKSFLIPVSLAITALSYGVEANCISETNINQDAKNNYTEQAKAIKSLFMIPAEQKSDLIFAQHSSHASHGSHGSHSSHYSGR